MIDITVNFISLLDRLGIVDYKGNWYRYTALINAAGLERSLSPLKQRVCRSLLNHSTFYLLCQFMMLHGLRTGNSQLTPSINI